MSLSAVRAVAVSGMGYVSADGMCLVIVARVAVDIGKDWHLACWYDHGHQKPISSSKLCCIYNESLFSAKAAFR